MLTLVYFLCVLARVYFVLVPTNECNGFAVENRRDVDTPNVAFPTQQIGNASMAMTGYCIVKAAQRGQPKH